ncbi:hypothetical protein EDD15DRAFT_1024798 [Pisolithus albus]|nr:hypothetical protein EDD15DRAFT_1024798 [Pisolithus albus]
MLVQVAAYWCPEYGYFLTRFQVYYNPRVFTAYWLLGVDVFDHTREPTVYSLVRWPTNKCPYYDVVRRREVELCGYPYGAPHGHSHGGDLRMAQVPIKKIANRKNASEYVRDVLILLSWSAGGTVCRIAINVFHHKFYHDVPECLRFVHWIHSSGRNALTPLTPPAIDAMNHFLERIPPIKKLLVC